MKWTLTGRTKELFLIPAATTISHKVWSLAEHILEHILDSPLRSFLLQPTRTKKAQSSDNFPVKRKPLRRHRSISLSLLHLSAACFFDLSRVSEQLTSSATTITSAAPKAIYSVTDKISRRVMGIPRLARLLIFSTLLITLPTLYLLYPHRDTILGTSTQIQDHLEQGGIDSTHWRDPLPPPVGIGDELEKLEHEEVRDWEGQDVLDQNELEGVELSPAPVLVEAAPVVSDEVIGKEAMEGGVIMPKLENATAKAELGRAAWKVLHLMTLRYPDTPTPSDREALKSYFHLFARLYPCGECAQEFQALLKEYPPQTSSRKSASMWLCHVHNLINARLGKAEFDCLTLDETYDCGCGPDGNSTTSVSASVAGETQTALSHEH